jgi:O-antigen ligase
MKWIVFLLMAGALGAGVFLQGGVWPAEWNWCGLAVGLAGGLCVVGVAPRERAPGGWWTYGLLLACAGWWAVQLAVVTVSPVRSWERVLDWLPALVAVGVARQVGWWWGERMWLVAAPVIVVAGLEGVLGLVQWGFMREAGGAAGSAVGTYVNRNHFAGLLEMALPLALMAAVAAWRKGVTRHTRPAGAALKSAGMLAVAACLLVGVVVSLSRMGFLSSLAAVGLTAMVVLGSMGAGVDGAEKGRRWVMGVGVGLAAAFLGLVFLPTDELIGRLAELAQTEDISKDTRAEIWRDTRAMIAAHGWTGVGVGAYQSGLYRFKKVAPMQTVDFAHNDYLQLLAELGWPGFAIVFALALRIGWRTLEGVLWGRGGRNWELSVGLLGALLTMVLHSLVDFNLYIPANALALGWLCGVADSPGMRRL